MNDSLKYLKRMFLAMLGAAFLAAAVFAQPAGISLRGQVTDPSGAAIPAATVLVTGPGGTTQGTETDEQGRYAFQNLAAGAYRVQITMKGFAPFSQANIQITSGKAQVLDARLAVTMEKQEVNVESESSRISVNPENNVSALVLKGEALKSLSDDPDELASELQALAGPAAGPNGGQIYIDGFQGGQLPPKDAILEVRVNQNPFSAQYHTLGYGRIEITTKPGFQKFHGRVFAFGNDSAFNSRNPFAAQIPDYHSVFYSGNVGGPIGKKASFFVDVYRRDIQDASVVNAIVLDQNLNQTPFNQAVLNPRARTAVRPRADFQLSNNNVLSVSYQYWKNSSKNNGIGQFDLPSQAYDMGAEENSFQANDTQVVSSRTVTQTRFRYEHQTSNQIPQSLDPSVNVLGAFTSGGNSGGKALVTENNYEFQSVTSMSLGKHNLTFGGRLVDVSQSQNTTDGYNGTFTFNSLNAYQITQQGLAQNLTPAQILAAGGGASQFAITAGNPVAQTNLIYFEPYFEDSWRIRPNVSLNLGLRFETQNHISNRANFAPRFGFAWGIGGGGKAPKTVLRGGFGLFYDHFQEAQVLQAQQLNGINQQRYVVNAPDFFPPNLPPTGTLANNATFPTIYQIGSTLRSPYTMEAAIGLERQITSNINASVTYINTHGVHQFLTRNINAPLPGTYDPADPTSGVRPLGNVGNIYQYEADGLFNENQLIANFNIRLAAVQLFGYYTLSYANTNTNGIGSFPMNQYNIAQDYGPAPFAVRNRFFLGGSFGLPYGITFSPFMVASSGRPYNVTVGKDLNGDSIFNDRPAFAAAGATGPNIVATQFGTFNIDPASSQAVIPYDYLTGPGQFSMNARVSKTFGFGKEVEGGGGGGGHRHGRGGLGGQGLSSNSGRGLWHGGSVNRRYQVEMGVMVHNVFNMVNLGTPVGNLSSPIFGQSNSLAGGFFGSQSANRSINMFMRFSF
ncbi:MAG TPA: carboxypeptidase regulatory-like domain-containing protein [Terriglobia bacterium]|nr:carboxypeptidase regulatory-like domain-containing protein [Terriglobia bacterium]